MSEHIYQNPDRRCVYYADGVIDYCWSYANHVDGKEGFEDMGPVCETCDMWQPTEPLGQKIVRRLREFSESLKNSEEGVGE